MKTKRKENLKSVTGAKTGVWLDIESKDYADVDASRLVAKFEDGSTIMYNQDNWPKLIVTNILILPL